MSSQSDSNKFDELRWVIQIRRTLEEELEDDAEVPVSIFNVSVEALLASHPESYTPQEVALGPYHYLRPELYEMERYKLAAAKRTAKQFQSLKFQNVVNQLTKVDSRIRPCYHKYLDFKDERLAWMMAIDASFLLEFLQVYAVQEGKTLTRVSSRMSHLVDYAGTKSAHNAFLRDMVSGVSHLLDFLYLPIVPKVEEPSEITEGEGQNYGKQEKESSSADSSYVKQLQDFIWKQVQKLNGGPIRLIKKVVLRNLVAYEASNASGPLVFTRYTELMNGIIDSDEDAKTLRENGIILNRLKNDEEVSKLWNGMSKSVKLTKVPFLDKPNVQRNANATAHDLVKWAALENFEDTLGRECPLQLDNSFPLEPIGHKLDIIKISVDIFRSCRSNWRHLLIHNNLRDSFSSFQLIIKLFMVFIVSTHPMRLRKSVAFTGIPLLAVAATWFFIFGLCLLILSCCRCCRGNSDSYSRIAYTLSLIFLVLLIITAITASGILYTAKGKFRSSTTNILEYLLDQSDRTVETLKDVLNNLEVAKEVGVQQQLFLPPYIQKDIENLGKTTNISAMIPQTKTQETSKQIRHFLDPVMQVLNIVAALMLLVAFVGFIFSVFGLQSAVYILMIIGWILVTGTFILCGISLILHNPRPNFLTFSSDSLAFLSLRILCSVHCSRKHQLDYSSHRLNCASQLLVLKASCTFHNRCPFTVADNYHAVTDSCVAMEEWVQHPTAHSALSELLPCMDHGTAKATLSISRDVAYLMVGRVNQFISTVANNHVAPSAGFIYYNQSGPLMPLLCSPLKFDSSNRRCAPGAVDLSHASRAWMNYVCKATQSGKCTSLGRLTPTSYDQITAAVNVSSTLNRHSSFLVGIVDCTFVRDTFNEIIMLSLILWPVYARKSGTRVKGNSINIFPIFFSGTIVGKNNCP
ncbi:hypothetical protein CJ030_MR3G026634 [Morella rubra]|uniref:Uncharacterized protein n=1 Tax=Morella rubra TaxID=262757 RepID=A0A6A1W0H8_9ROSI|nr:hypothetical protein CJ030_MR3G026634 [Morella rubra]